MALLPVGSPTPSVAERSNFPGAGLICHLIAGVTLLKPAGSEPSTGAKYVGMSRSTSRHGAMPSRSRLLVPSNSWPPACWLKLTPFSFWKLPCGTTRLELVTSGRSVSIGLSLCGH
jgi:hypothetical protein